MELKKIVITGGPCAGKTTALSWIQNYISQLGYTVLFVPETATELLGGGVCPWTCGTNADYQIGQMELQLTKERIFERAARTMPKDKILIVCDRGAIDNRAYMNDEEFNIVLESTGLSEVELRDSYDAVFHLVTAANGAEKYYSFETNSTRYETVEEAVNLDKRIIKAWTGHPHLRIIDNSTSFDEKMKRLIKEISFFLGESVSLEIERRLLIEYPDIKWLESLPNCRKVDIVQTYLIAPPNEERRIRKRGENGSYIYYKTTKRQISDVGRLEVEQRLRKGDYEKILKEADPELNPVIKTRYCLTWKDKYYEIDIYPFWKDRAILEVELDDENEPIVIPDGIKVIRDVSTEKEYKNSSLARSIPK
jgi:CYTH domain-containing protein/thymidylate kinase